MKCSFELKTLYPVPSTSKHFPKNGTDAHLVPSTSKHFPKNGTDAQTQIGYIGLYESKTILPLHGPSQQVFKRCVEEYSPNDPNEDFQKGLGS